VLGLARLSRAGPLRMDQSQLGNASREVSVVPGGEQWRVQSDQRLGGSHRLPCQHWERRRLRIDAGQRAHFGPLPVSGWQPDFRHPQRHTHRPARTGHSATRCVGPGNSWGCLSSHGEGLTKCGLASVAVLELDVSPEPDGRGGGSRTPVLIVSPKVHCVMCQIFWDTEPDL